MFEEFRCFPLWLSYVKDGRSAAWTGFLLFCLIDQLLDFTRKCLVTSTRLCGSNLEGDRVEALVISGAVALQECFDLCGSGHAENVT